MRLPIFVAAVSIAIGWAGTRSAGAGEWTQDSFDEFRTGTFFDAGSNIYVSAKGRIQIISRWDLNGDGFLDLVVPSGHGHNEKEDTFVYFNNGSDIDGRTRVKIPANGSTDGLVHDFNKDGLSDIAVCNGRNGINSRTDAYVYYGASQGMSADNRTVLPAMDSRSIACGDFNADGWTDLAIACQWQAGEIGAETGPKLSFVYWNGPNGFQPDQRASFTFGDNGALAVLAGKLDADDSDDLLMLTPDKSFMFYAKDGAIEDRSKRVELPFGGTAAAMGDVNGDGHVDLAICHARGVRVLLAEATGFAADAKPIEVQVETPRDVELEDFDGDGMADLAVANFAAPGGASWTNSYVYFSDGKTFSSRPRTELFTLGASSVTAGDLNADGRPELVISNQRETSQHSVPSAVYWNDGGTFRHGHHTQLDTEGAAAAAIGDVNNDGRPDVVFFNNNGGVVEALSHSTVYWGDGTRNYSAQRSRVFTPTYHTSGIGHADLDDDGSVELVMCQTKYTWGVGTQREVTPMTIYWDGNANFPVRSHLTIDNADGGVKIADFNRDGYLDLMFGATVVDHSGEQKKSMMVIYCGSASGFSNHNRMLVPAAAGVVRCPAVADLNKDGWLDLARPAKAGEVQILWGDAMGFSGERATTFKTGRDDSLMYLNAADLNRDGWLDLVLPCRHIRDNTEVSSLVYFGSEKGFSSERRVELPTVSPYDMSISDYDNDGWLDVFMNSYGGTYKRDFPSYIYWGGSAGLLSRPRTEIPANASSAAESADYDGDGWIDLFVANHRKNGSTTEPGPHRHQTDSMVYWGSPSGFSERSRLLIPSIGPHSLNLRDVGNTYDRGLYEDYTSAPHELPSGEQASEIRWKAETPHGTAVRFQMRAADTREALNTAAWQGPDGTDGWFTESGTKIRNVSGRWIQYRARLTTPNGGATPYLASVTVLSR